jgi:uncharacterized protein (DUF983 family)
MSFGVRLYRALRLRCPVCGKGKIFKGFFRSHRECSECGCVYDREPGFFLGSIYFNYGLTALISAIAYPVLSFGRFTTDSVAMAIVFTFAILFPLWFFRYARSLWLGMDQFWDPREKTE